jgi:hypothetical protein
MRITLSNFAANGDAVPVAIGHRTNKPMARCWVMLCLEKGPLEHVRPHSAGAKRPIPEVTQT